MITKSDGKFAAPTPQTMFDMFIQKFSQVSTLYRVGKREL